MNESSLTEKELRNIKTICEYLFFDQFKDSASYQGFERAFSSLLPKKEIQLDIVFKEICGEKKKYINYQRFIKTYIKYKKNENLKEDTKIFFNEIFNNILKSPGDFIGNDMEKSLKFTTATYKNRENLSKISVLTNSKEKIFGINIEYEDVLTCKMFPRKLANELEVKLEMLFGLLDEEEMKKNKLANILKLKEKSYRDSITHIFGTFTKKITFLGFKCRSGKTEFIGKPKGEGFLFGNFGEQFHYLKMQISNKGINKLEPHFIESKRKNVFLTGKLSEITNAFLKKDEMIKDEINLQNITDELEIDKMITTPVMKESYFFDKKLIDKVRGKTFVEVCDYAPRKWLLDINTNKKKENGEFYTLNEILSDYQDELKSSMLKPQLKRTKRIKEDDLNKVKEEKKGKLRAKRKKNNKDVWDVNSFKNLKVKMLLKSKDNYRILLDKLNNKIQNDIRKEDPEVYDLKKSLLDKIIYNPNENRKSDNGEIFRQSLKKQIKKAEEKLIEEEKKDNQLERQNNVQISSKLRGNKKTYQNIPQVNCGYYYNSNAMDFYNNAFNFYGYNPNNNNNFNNFGQPGYFGQPGNFGNFGNFGYWNMYNNFNYDNFMFRRRFNNLNYNFAEIYNKYQQESENNKELTKKAQKNWKNLSELLSKNQGIYIIQTIGSVLKAVNILEKCDSDKKFEETLPLSEKIRLYKLLTENENIINFLSSSSNKDKEEEDDNNSDNSDDEEILIPDEHPEEITDLTELTQKMDSIEKLLKEGKLSEEKQLKLEKLHYLYQQQKNILIENETLSAQKEIKLEGKYDTNRIIKEEEEKRKRLLDEENKKIEEAARKLISNEQKQKIQTASISDKPSPKKIYLNQPLYKGRTPFTDSYFPPEISSLCETDSNGDWILPPDAIPDDVDGWENIKFCRAKEIFDTENYQVFHNGIDPDDILQGSLGDCYFLSAIGALCKFPKLIEKLFYIKEKSKENCYGVYLFINGI